MLKKDFRQPVRSYDTIHSCISMRVSADIFEKALPKRRK